MVESVDDYSKDCCVTYEGDINKIKDKLEDKIMNMSTTTETVYNNGQKVGYRRALQDFVDSFYEECRIYGPNDKFNKVKFFTIVDKIKDKLEATNG